MEARGGLTFWEHTAILRRYILLTLGTFIAGATATHALRNYITDALLQPVGDTPMQFLSPLDPVLFLLKVDFFGGLFLALPVLAWSIVSFFGPAIPSGRILRVTGLLVLGMVLAWGAAGYTIFFALPFVIDILSSITVPGVAMALSAQSYLGFAVMLTMLHVLIAQLPIGIVIAAALGILNPRSLARRRREVYLGLAVGLAIVTPTTDVVSLLLLLIPSVLLLEVGILCGTFVYTDANEA